MKLYKIKKSKIDNKGRGLYASKNIKSGTKIINYKGKIITNKELDGSEKYDNNKPIYLFTLNKRYTLDGDFPWNIAGLVNHSCDPNSEYEGKGFKVWITAAKEIKKGEEITYDYGFEFDKDDYKDHICKCGSKNCIGYIVTTADWKKLAKYLKKQKKMKEAKRVVKGLVYNQLRDI